MKRPSVILMRGAVLGIMLLFLLPACSRTVTISTQLEETGGLRAGDRVYLDILEVGSVERIDTAEPQPGFIIEIGLAPDHAGLVQENAVAYVPLEGPPRLVLVNPTESALAVARGGRLKGLTPLELVIWQVHDAAGQASSLIEALALRIDSYFESDQWRETRAGIDREVAEMSERSRALAERVVRELEALVESLAESAEHSANELSEDLARIGEEIDRLEAEGYEDLANSLRQLVEQIEARAERDQGPSD